MKTKIYLFLFVFVFIFAPFLLFAADETLTITTYYPSPYGSYNQLSVASNTYLAYSSGSVGIGTTGPGAKLDIAANGGGSGATSPVLRITNTNTGTVTVGAPLGSLEFYSSVSPGLAYPGVGAAIKAIEENVNGYKQSLAFYTASMDTAAAEWMRITSGGNVGIGTTDTTTGGFNNKAVIKQGADGNWRGLGIEGNASGGNVLSIDYLGSNTFGIYTSYRAAPATYSDIAFGPGGSEKMRITTGGNVGIGTTNPGAALEVYGSSYSQMALNSGAAGGFARTWYKVGAGTGAGQQWNVGLRGDTSNVFAFEADTTGSGSWVKHMVIQPGGNVGIGTASPDASAKLDVRGAIYAPQQTSWNTGGFRAIYSSAGTNNYRHIYVNSTGGQLRFYNGLNEPYIDDNGNWNNASDISLKKNIVDIKYGLNDLMKLKPRSYRMKYNNDAQIGFVAQEVEKVIPEVVSGENGKKGLSYGQLVALAVKGIQEQQKEIESLKSEIQQLKAKL